MDLSSGFPLQHSGLRSSHTSSVRSLESVPQSTFGKHMPQEVEAVEVNLPRGMRVFGSKAIAGQGKASPSKTYSMTVEPNGYTIKAKAVFRETARPLSVLDLDEQRGWSNDDESQEGNGAHIRASFRRERYKRFEVGRHFPALATPRLVPTWKAVAGVVDGDQQAAQKPSKRRKDHIMLPTLSSANKLSSKLETIPATPFVGGTNLSAQSEICNRVPVLFGDMYESEKEAQNTEKKRSIDRKSFVSCGIDAEENISAAQQKDHGGTAILNQRYVQKLEAYKRTKSHGRNVLSHFEVYHKEKIKERKGQRESIIQGRPVPKAFNNFAALNVSTSFIQPGSDIVSQLKMSLATVRSRHNQEQNDILEAQQQQDGAAAALNSTEPGISGAAS